MEQIRELLRTCQNFAIAGHISPDGDSIGACFGLAMSLEKMGKQACVLAEPFEAKYNILPGRHLLYGGPLDTLTPEVFIAVDCGDKWRLGDAAKAVFKRSPITVCVDHHMTNPGFAQINLIDGNMSSTSEMVFNLLEPLVELDIPIASALYGGMVYDTGGFRYSTVTQETYNIAGRLMAMGIPFTEIYSGLLYGHRFAAVKLMGLAMAAAELRFDGQIAYACITCEMLAEAGASGSDLDGVVEYLLNTNGVKASVIFYEKNKRYMPERSPASLKETGSTKPDSAQQCQLADVKVSLRSKSIAVDAIAQRMGGGGHTYAAGISLTGNINEIAEDILDKMKAELDAHV